VKPTIKAIQIDKIKLGERTRPIDRNWVQAIASSIETIGLMYPIIVWGAGEGFLVVDGGHRLEANRTLGRKTIDTIVAGSGTIADFNDLRLREVTANLIRYDLTVLERAVNLWTLKRIHEEKNPETGHGKRRKPQANDNVEEIKVANLATLSKRFTAEIAEGCDLSERVVRRLVKIAEGIAPEIRAKLFPTWLAKHQAGLIALSEQAPEIQAKIFDLLFCDDPQAKTVADALDLISGRPPETQSDKFYTRTISSWSRLSRKQQDAFFKLHETDVRRFAKAKGWIR